MIIDPIYAHELLQRQITLQNAAQSIIETLNLRPTLSKVGEVEVVGSCSLGLMVWQDIDLRVLCQELNAPLILELMMPFFTTPLIMKINYRHKNPGDSPLNRRFYFQLFYLPEGATVEWKIDISFWLAKAWGPNGLRDHIAERDRINCQMSDEKKLAILWIKDMWYQRPTYPQFVNSKHIYQSVLDHEVRTPLEFEQYLVKNGLPV